MWVCWFIKKVLSGNPMPKVTVLYLFYDSNNRHVKRAMQEVKSGEFSVGYTYTFPQEVKPAVTPDDNPTTLYDWRYCLHPQEGVLVNALAAKHNLLFVPTQDVFN